MEEMTPKKAIEMILYKVANGEMPISSLETAMKALEYIIDEKPVIEEMEIIRNTINNIINKIKLMVKTGKYEAKGGNWIIPLKEFNEKITNERKLKKELNDLGILKSISEDRYCRRIRKNGTRIPVMTINIEKLGS